MSLYQLRVIDGGRDDLVSTIIRAIEMAKASQSSTTVYLLNMALLNEGMRLAADLSKEKASSNPRAASFASSDGLQQRKERTAPISTSRSVRSRDARPRQSPLPGRPRPPASETRSSTEDPALSGHANLKPSSTAAWDLPASLGPRD